MFQISDTEQKNQFSELQNSGNDLQGQRGMLIHYLLEG